MPASDEDVVLAKMAKMAAITVAKAVCYCVPISEADLNAIDKCDPSVPDAEKSFFEQLKSQGYALTPGIWSFVLQHIGQRWQMPDQAFATFLPALRTLHPAAGNPLYDAMLDEGAHALAFLGWMSCSEDEAAMRGDETMAVLYRMALALNGAGNPSLAFDLAALALDVGRGFGTDYEQLSRFAIELALKAGKSHQLALTSAVLAAAAAIDTDTNPGRQLETFDLCETALERIAGASEPYRTTAASMLVEQLRPRSYLHTLLPALVGLMAAEHQPPAFRKQVGSKPWPLRVSELPWTEWNQVLAARLTAQQWDGISDGARLALEQRDEAHQVVADWTHWTIDHQAYRRAVPHLGSFLREAKFDENFVVLTHEITHVLSMLGALGIASSALRAATLDAELTLWSAVPGIEDDRSMARFSSEGVAPLVPGDSAQLLRAEQSIELCLKGRILQDIWTPWFEGLAMFGELSAEPGMDTNGINVVTGCMRNLIDFIPTEDALNDRKAHLAQFEQHIAEFEQRCGAAIKTVGPRRLRAYLEREDVPYLLGYLAVRATVATWRYTSRQTISGNDAYNLLLHATRYGTGPFIPDLSLRSDLFESAARTMMTQWAATLAGLDPNQIAMFLQPIDRDGAGRKFRWTDMRLQPVDSREEGDELVSVLETRVGQALASLSRQKDEQRVASADAATSQYLEKSAAALRDYLESDTGRATVVRTAKIASQVLQLNSLLPIGRAQGKFFLNLPPGDDSSYMGVQARTTEARAADGTPSLNAIWFPINRSAADTIAAHYRQSGSSRVEVTRLIDLGGNVFSGSDYSSHFFSYKYGDWHDVFGTTPILDAGLKADPARYSNALNLARARLYPEAMLRAEGEFIARGTLSAKRTRDWIDASPSWQDDDLGISAALARHVHKLTDQVLDSSTRRARQRCAGVLLLEALQLPPSLVEMVAESNFSEITEQVHRRDDIIDALLATARYPAVDASIGALAALLADVGLPIFYEGPQGWDVCPSGLIPTTSQGE